MADPIPDDDSDDLTERVTFKTSKDLLSTLNRAAGRSFASRSDYIRGALVQRLQRDGVMGVNIAEALLASGVGELSADGTHVTIRARPGSPLADEGTK